MHLYFYTNVGKVRQNNEDGCLIKCREENISIYDSSLSSPIKKEKYCYTFIVSDGMGGTQQGEVATKLLLDNFNKYDFKTKIDLENILKYTIKQLEESKIDGGCAFAGVRLFLDKLYIFNVGDCRIYKKTKNYAKRISKDHSLVEKMLDSGLINIEEAHNHPKSNILTSSVMPYKNFNLFFKEIKLKKGDIFLICSDGVWGELSIDELDKCFEEQSIDDINNALFSELSLKEQNDNLTYILLEI